MNAVEFTTELSGSRVLTVPADVADQLPRSGRVRVLLLTEDDGGSGGGGGDATTSSLDEAYERAYTRLPEDVSLTTSLLPHLAVDDEDWA